MRINDTWKPVLEPYKYLSSLPSKGIRDRAIDALNCWLNLPNTYIVTVKEIITILHNASLMYARLILRRVIHGC
jgi:hypothetical protein